MYTLLARAIQEEDHPKRCKPISQSFPVCKMDFLWLAIVAVVITFFVCCLERLYRSYKRNMDRSRSGESTWSKAFLCSRFRLKKDAAKRDKRAATGVTLATSEGTEPEKGEQTLPGGVSHSSNTPSLLDPLESSPYSPSPSPSPHTDPYLTKSWSSFDKSLLLEEGRISRPPSTYAPRSPDIDNRNSAPTSGTDDVAGFFPWRRLSPQSRSSPTLKPLLLCENLSFRSSSSLSPTPTRTPSTSSSKSKSSPTIFPLTRTPTPPPRIGRARSGTVVTPLMLAPPCTPTPLATRPRELGLLAAAAVNQTS